MGVFNQVILSANEDETYLSFWKPVSWAYKMMYPEVTVHLAFLTHRTEDDPFVEDLRKYGKVTLFKPVSDVPEFAQAKMIRFILASQEGNDVVYIDDIDLFPLTKPFIDNKVGKRQGGYLLCVGGEVYDNNGCYPISQMTAEGHVWKKVINPNNVSYRELMDEWKGEVKFDRREDICIKLDWAADNYFSDERLLRRLYFNNPVPKQEMARGYDNYLDSTIDRHTWDKHKQEWVYDREKLKRGEYFNAHGTRPYTKFEEHYQPLINYIENTYGKK